MFTSQGIPVMTGIAVGKVLLLQNEQEWQIRGRHVPEEFIPGEVQKVEEAIRKGAEDVEREIAQLEEHTGIASKILEFHKALILSPDLKREIVEKVKEKSISAEYAVYSVLRRWQGEFSNLDREVASQKRYDLLDVERKIMRHLSLLQPGDFHELREEVVVVAHNLTPSQTASLDKSKVKGFATDIGGKSSHTAIMARALAIPSVVGAGELSKCLQGGETAIVDAIKGIVIVDPDESTLERYRELESRHARAFSALVAERDLPSETIDGYKVDLLANIELVEEVEMTVRMGASGIGLYRTEFLYEENHEPDEELQLESYRKVVRALGNSPCVIRTVDLGADKFLQGIQQEPEPNPFLGTRSIRYSLLHPESFHKQLRAILRATVFGDVWLVLPMISSIEELRQCKQHLEEAKAELRSRGERFREDMPVGVMVEVPSAALLADRLADEVNFFSIGTNDLVQYALAVDRVNARVAHLYQPASPSVLRLLKQVVSVVREKNVDICVCGEMSAEPQYVLLLLGLGLRKFSVAPVAIPLVKHIVRSVTFAEAEAVAEKALGFYTSGECNKFMQERVATLLPAEV